ncbi:hypothetical protein [Dactylosporangium sp. CA-139066]|uniref:hypothetical protein n=1 Tax=Dactylosporangium sp. CA-139066 TaxID=3239930 RepID=UPI003D93DD37
MTSPYVAFPDAEIAVLDYLRLAIPGILCNVEAPDGYRPDDGVFVRVERIGGQPNFPVSDYPLLDIEAYGPTRDAASQGLAEALAVLAVARYRADAAVAFGEMTVITGAQFVRDPVTKEDRWHAMVSIGIRAKRV